MAKIKFHRVGIPESSGILFSSQGQYIPETLQKQALKEAKPISFLCKPNREGDVSPIEVIITVRKAETNEKKS